MPSLIASTIAYVSLSRVVEDFSTKDSSPSGARYGYGRFIGADGTTDIGIARQRYVIPLKIFGIRHSRDDGAGEGRRRMKVSPEV
jgi:hypothetical protein